MNLPPLTHHDIIRHASVLTARGERVDLARSDRDQRVIQFQWRSSSIPEVSLAYSLQVGKGDVTLVTRALAHQNGLISTITAIVRDVNALLDVLADIPLQRQIKVNEHRIVASSYSLIHPKGTDKSVSSLQLKFICARVGALELRVDTSASSAMPADVRVLIDGTRVDYLRESLADGTDSPLVYPYAQSLFHDAETGVRVATSTTLPATTIKRLPEDILAVLGPQWRPLVYQGDHWKGVLRLLGDGEQRTRRAENWVYAAIDHLAQTLASAPGQYHERQKQSRWAVYFRRLRPLMLFIGILALMPVSWFFVSEGGVQMHPLALGLTPLLMVGVIVLTAREIPVMEIPPRPGPLSADAWSNRLDNRA